MYSRAFERTRMPLSPFSFCWVGTERTDRGENLDFFVLVVRSVQASPKWLHC